MTQRKERRRMGWVWCYMPVTPAIQEVEAEGSRSKATLGKSRRPYLKNKLKKQKDWDKIFKWYGVCLASVGP
jgi:hypothetical protein